MKYTKIEIRYEGGLNEAGWLELFRQILNGEEFGIVRTHENLTVAWAADINSWEDEDGTAS